MGVCDRSGERILNGISPTGNPMLTIFKRFDFESRALQERVAVERNILHLNIPFLYYRITTYYSWMQRCNNDAEMICSTIIYSGKESVRGLWEKVG
jgi:hypothetical protein